MQIHRHQTRYSRYKIVHSKTLSFAPFCFLLLFLSFPECHTNGIVCGLISLVSSTYLSAFEIDVCYVCISSSFMLIFYHFGGLFIFLLLSPDFFNILNINSLPAGNVICKYFSLYFVFSFV